MSARARYESAVKVALPDAYAELSLNSERCMAPLGRAPTFNLRTSATPDRHKPAIRAVSDSSAAHTNCVHRQLAGGGRPRLCENSMPPQFRVSFTPWPLRKNRFWRVLRLRYVVARYSRRVFTRPRSKGGYVASRMSDHPMRHIRRLERLHILRAQLDSQRRHRILQMLELRRPDDRRRDLALA
jgi:hypothetical protein